MFPLVLSRVQATASQVQELNMTFASERGNQVEGADNKSAGEEFEATC